MPKARYKTTNWKQYNKALINRGSLTFWIDEETIREWKQSKTEQARQASSIQWSCHYNRIDGETSFLYAIESAARFSRLSI